MIDDALHMKYIPASKTNLYFNPDTLLEAMPGYPVANRREARKLGLLRQAKVPKLKRERHKPAHTVGEKGSLFGLLPEEGATQAPVIASRWSV